MTSKDILRIGFRVGGLYLLAHALIGVSLTILRLYPTNSSLASWDSTDSSTIGILGQLFLLGCSVYLLRGAPHLIRFSKAEEQPITADATPKTLLSLICFLFGIFFTIQTLVDITGLMFCIKQLYQPQNPSSDSHSAFHQIIFIRAALSMAIHVIGTLYLLRGAPHLVRFMEFKKTTA